jgi:hypothetical protein
MTTYTTDDTLTALRANIESDHDVAGFGTVYLDNARLDGQTPTQFRAHLAALAKRGDYIVVDGECFGAVRRA